MLVMSQPQASKAGEVVQPLRGAKSFMGQGLGRDRCWKHFRDLQRSIPSRDPISGRQSRVETRVCDRDTME